MIYFTPHVLDVSSILHVALLVFLRLRTVRNPYLEGESLYKVRRLGIIIIWFVSIMFCILPLMALVLKMKDYSTIIRLIGLTGLSTLPVIGIIIMWGILIWTAKVKQAEDRNNRPSTPNAIIHSISRSASYERNNQRAAVIMQSLVIVLLICYIPYLAWKHYIYVIVVSRTFAKFSRKVRR